MPSPKLLLTIVTGGVLLGALMGQMANPRMKFADAADRSGHSDPQYSATPLQSVDAGPEDLSPSGWFGPAYAQPAVFAPQYAPIPEYAPQTEAEAYSSADEALPNVAPEVDQASVDAAATAAALSAASPASPARSAASPPQGRPDPAPADLAPADKTS
jgi:hypothetical protein